MQGTSWASRVLAVGPLPPPTHGVSVANSILAHAYPELRFFSPSVGKSSVKGMGKLNIRNAFSAGLALWRYARVDKTEWLYVCLSQNRMGLLRDSAILDMTPRSIPVVLHIHGGGFPDALRSLARAERRSVLVALRRARAVLVLHDKFSQPVQEVMPWATVRTVQNGCYPIADEPIARPQRDVLTLLYVGGLFRSKGIVDAVDAVGILNQPRVRSRIVLAGELPDRNTIRALRQSIGYPWLEMPGSVSGDYKHRLFERADIFIMPSAYPLEGQPLALLEAMSASLPIIATEHAAISETVGPGGAIFVPKHDPVAIVHAVEMLMEHGDRVREMGLASFQRFVDHAYDDAGFAKRWGEAMLQIMGS